MGYKNMKKQKMHIKALRKLQKIDKIIADDNELTEQEFRRIENTIPLNGND